MKKNIIFSIIIVLTSVITFYFSYDYGQNKGYQLAESEAEQKLVSEYNKGFEEGKESGYDEGYSEGNSDGYSEGYNEGYDDGNSDGYDDGYDDGNSDGYNDGYDDGSLEGHSQGYDEGYNDANSNDYTQSYNNNQSYSYDVSPIVYITLTGSKYHRITCSYLKNSAVEISRKQAEIRGYSACSKCRPDKIK